LWLGYFVILGNLRAADKTLGELTASELHAIRNYLLQMVQRDSFPAEYEALRHDLPLPTSPKIVRFRPFCDHNHIRFGGRLQFADLSHTEKHPILLDGCHHVTQFLIRHTHIQLHHLASALFYLTLDTSFGFSENDRTSKKSYAPAYRAK
jgi:hypothetical protein